MDMRRIIDIITEAHNPKNLSLKKRGVIQPIDSDYDEILPQDLTDLTKFVQQSIDPNLDPEAVVFNKEIKAAIKSAINRLPALEKLAVHLIIYQNIPVEHIDRYMPLRLTYIQCRRLYANGIRKLSRDQKLTSVLKQLVNNKTMKA